MQKAGTLAGPSLKNYVALGQEARDTVSSVSDVTSTGYGGFSIVPGASEACLANLGLCYGS